MLSGISKLLEQLPRFGVAPIAEQRFALEVLEDISKLPLEVVEKGGVVSASLQANGFDAEGHGDGVEVRLGLDYKRETWPHAVSEIRQLPPHLSRSEVGGHGSHSLGNPPHYALPYISAAQGVSILVETSQFDFDVRAHWRRPASLGFSISSCINASGMDGNGTGTSTSTSSLEVEDVLLLVVVVISNLPWAAAVISSLGTRMLSLGNVGAVPNERLQSGRSAAAKQADGFQGRLYVVMAEA